jgi:hypothetical protein
MSWRAARGEAAESLAEGEVMIHDQAV